MRFIAAAFVAVILLAAPVFAGEDGLTGYWKFSFYDEGQPITFWLIQLAKDKDGKLTASAEQLKRAPKVKIEDVRQDGDTLKMKFVATFLVQGEQRQVPFEYEARLPKPGAKKIYGSLSQGGATMPALMEATAAKTPFDVDREIVQRTPSDPKAMLAIVDVIERAKDAKVDAKDLQGLVDTSMKAAETYGPTLHATHQLRLLSALQAQKAYASVAVETARKISKQSMASAPIETQLQILTKVGDVLRGNDLANEAKAFVIDAAGKISKRIEKAPLDSRLNTLSSLSETLHRSAKEEASKYDAAIEKLEGQAYTEHLAGKNALNFKPVKFAGRKMKSDRAVLVELFTGAQCPPCVAADMAFDGVEKTYGPGEVVLLQYHMHIPGPDPLSNADGYARFDYYADAYPGKVRGTPTSLFNGKRDAIGGGSRDDAPDKYKEFCEVVNKLLEAPTAIKLTLNAVRAGQKLDITAKVEGVEKPGEKVRLRIALVEDWVRYKGGNGLQYHHRIVRAMPGGAKGFAVKDKNVEQQTSLDLDKLRADLNKFLNEEYPEGPRPMRLHNLSVVAFVQDDATVEVLQAVQAPVREGK